MAKAIRNNHPAPKYSTDPVTLKLSAGEARFLRYVMGNVSGLPYDTARKHADDIREALLAVGVEVIVDTNLSSGDFRFLKDHEAFQ